MGAWEEGVKFTRKTFVLRMIDVPNESACEAIDRKYMVVVRWNSSSRYYTVRRRDSGCG